MKIRLDCIGRITRLCRLHEWTATSLSYCYTSLALHQWINPPQSSVLILKYVRNVTTPKHHPRNLYCVLTQVQGRYTCHWLPLHNAKPLPTRPTDTQHCAVWSWLSPTPYCRYYSLTIRTFYKSGTSSPHVSPLLATTFEVPDKDSTIHCIIGGYRQLLHCRDWNHMIYRNQVAICAVVKNWWRVTL